MTAIGTDRPHQPLVAPEPPGDLRQVRRRRALPGGRAVVGGFLMVASGVGVFASYTISTAAPDTSYVAVRRDVVAGERLTAADLALVPLELPEVQRGRAFLDPAELVDAVARVPLEAGELVQRSAVTSSDSGSELAQISVPVDPARAMLPSERYVTAGERVDVIATFDRSGSAEAVTVSRDAAVVEVLGLDGAVGGSGAVTVVLAVPPEELQAVARAASAGEITLARTTGLRRGGASTATSEEDEPEDGEQTGAPDEPESAEEPPDPAGAPAPPAPPGPPAPPADPLPVPVLPPAGQ